jgi:hypothetical protein
VYDVYYLLRDTYYLCIIISLIRINLLLSSSERLGAISCTCCVVPYYVASSRALVRTVVVHVVVQSISLLNTRSAWAGKYVRRGAASECCTYVITGASTY